MWVTVKSLRTRPTTGVEAPDSVEVRVRLRSIYRRLILRDDFTNCNRLYLIFADASALITVVFAATTYPRCDVSAARIARDFITRYADIFTVRTEYCLELSPTNIADLTQGTLSESQQIEKGTMSKGCIMLNELDCAD